MRGVGSLRGDAGFTLVDTLVGTVVGTILMVALVGVFLTSYTSLRVSQETLQGDADVQLTLTYLEVDVHGSSRDPNLLTVTNGGNTLKLSSPDPSSAGRLLTITYTYASAGNPAVGTLTRTVTDSTGATIRTGVVAHNLTGGLTNVFSATPCTPSPGAGCTSVSAALSFDVKGVTLTRTVQAAPQLAYP